MDKLESIFTKQKAFDNIVQVDLESLPIEEIISKKSTAIIHEAVELQRLTNWKWWKDFDKLDMKESKEELLDIMFFVVSTAISLGMSAKDFYNEYNRKYTKNVIRQINREGWSDQEIINLDQLLNK